MAESKKIEDVGAVLKKVSDLSFKGGGVIISFFMSCCALCSLSLLVQGILKSLPIVHFG